MSYKEDQITDNDQNTLEELRVMASKGTVLIPIDVLKSVCPARPGGIQRKNYRRYLLEDPEYKRKKKRVYNRDRGRCRVCGKPAGMWEIHHLTYERMFCEKQSDMITVHVGCHSNIHDKPAKMRAAKARRRLRLVNQ